MVKRFLQRKIYKRKKKFLITLLKAVGILFIGSVFLGCIVFIIFIKDLPRPERFSEGIIPQSTKIYDREGEVILYEIVGK